MPPKRFETDTLDIINQAACTSADHRIMLSPRLADLVLARQYCVVCPVRVQCLQLVRPRSSRFDGTAGGFAWRDGSDVTDQVNRLMQYSEYFVFKPDRTRVPLIAASAHGQFPIVWLKKDEKMLLAFSAKANSIDERKVAKWLDIPVAAVTVINEAVDVVITRSLRHRVTSIRFTGRNIKKAPPPSWAGLRKQLSDSVLFQPGVEGGDCCEDGINERADVG